MKSKFRSGISAGKLMFTLSNGESISCECIAGVYAQKIVADIGHLCQAVELVEIASLREWQNNGILNLLKPNTVLARILERKKLQSFSALLNAIGVETIKMPLIDLIYRKGDTAEDIASKLEKSGILERYILVIIDRLIYAEYLEFAGRWADDGGREMPDDE